ncbi:8791_t:CDS:10 [Gigaspora margarita]|uniref:8791_t:CDS:1 n=1 Tax=Gigaspora margarita TaxID=4874 RepID=A0ABN7V178_GIGMA|nr:8791_t:CDS:10 [Gigaspora margarita]
MSLANFQNFALNILKETKHDAVQNTEVTELPPCKIYNKKILTVNFESFTILPCGHSSGTSAIADMLGNNLGLNSPMNVLSLLPLLNETTQKKRSREDSNKSPTSISSKKAKKTKKPVDRDQSPTLLTTADPGNEEILQTEPTSESNNDSNIFLNLYNKIVVGKDQLKKTTQVDDDVQNQLPKDISEEALRKRIERAQKVYGLFSSINVDVNIVSLVYLAVKENLQIEENQLKSIVKDVTKSAMKKCERNSSRYKIFQKIPHQAKRSLEYLFSLQELDSISIDAWRCSFLSLQWLLKLLPSYWPYRDSNFTNITLINFSIAFEGVHTLCNIKSSINPLSDDEIQYNLRKLKTDLFNSKSSHATYLLSNLEGVKTSDLSWDDPLASQVVDANSKYVKEMPDHALKSFMEPEDNMRVSAPGFIREKCDEFVLKFADDSEEILPVKLTHNESWKESDEVLNRVTTGILDLFAERQSVSSADRKGKSRMGKQPDIMFIVNYKERIHELAFAECSRLVCTKEKEKQIK